MNEKLYLVIKYTDHKETGKYGVNEDFTLIFATTDKVAAEMVRESENDRCSYKATEIIEAELNKRYGIISDNAPVLGSSFYIE